MRVALVASLALGLLGCGALNANSTRSATQVAADGIFYGAAALASSARAPTDSAPAHAVTHHVTERSYRYHCVAADGERTVRAHSRAQAVSACGIGCSCADPLMSEELRLYERRRDRDAY